MDNLKLITMSDVESEHISFQWKPYPFDPLDNLARYTEVGHGNDMD